jgi:hypothetical protein
MGLMDKLKEAAQEGAEVAKKGMTVAKERVDDVQARRKADDLAKQLGYLIVRERTQGSPSEEADRLVSEITKLEESIAAEGAAPTESGDPSDAPSGTES